ncbi:N-acetylmuramoyl-L-alanine amidase [Weissella koreensis]|uniref:N-acetylmuramoyl-L-alanine amidase n=1 Tax=Weissella koreensis TaxID=165096 RepID=UPI0022BA30BC|nr:N-acetylmuramoyl-L-alanine amidase [Weissella koreensis]MCZ9311147.1 N-acetylmuramoyl-L-alanine amidase [Weissella koreensis]
MKFFKIMGVVSITIGIGIVSNISSISANTVNDYILGEKFPKLNKQNDIQQWLNNPNWENVNMNYRNGHPEGVVVHETANSGDKWDSNAIWNEINYMLNNANSAFVHSFVDANNVVEIANPNYMSWGSGAEGNRRFIQTESTEVSNKKDFAKEIWNMANLQASYLRQFKLKPKLGITVWSHAMVSQNLGGTDHTDPTGYWANSARQYFNSTYTMNDYEVLLEHAYNSMFSPKYKVGQKVQVLSSAIYETNGNPIVNRRNMIGTIKKVTANDYSNSHFEYYVDFGKGITNQHIAEQDLTNKVIYPAKYKVGQRVQVLDTAIYETNGNSIVNRREMVGTIKKVTRKDYSNSQYEYYVDFGKGITNQHIAEQDLTNNIINPAKYKVGQRVQVLNTASYETNGYSIVNRRGMVGTVKKVTRKDYSNSHFEYFVDFGNGIQHYYMAEQDLTANIVQYKAKYKVGQRVQVLNTASYETNGFSIVNRRGMVGTVKKVTPKNYSNSHFEYFVDFGNGIQHYYMAEQDLTANIVQNQAKFKVGQRVQVLNTASYETNGFSIVNRRGMVGTVKKVTPKNYSNSHFEYFVDFGNGIQHYYMAEQDLTANISKYDIKSSIVNSESARTYEIDSKDKTEDVKSDNDTDDTKSMSETR